MLLDTPTPPHQSLCLALRGASADAGGGTGGLALGPRPPSPPQPGWRPLDAAERLPHPAPAPPSSLTGGIAPGAPEIPPASIETNPADPEHHLGGLSMRPARSASHRAVVPAGCAERRAVTPPPFVHREARSQLSGSPAGLSTYQALGHVDHFIRSRLHPRWEGAAGTCTNILEGALFWKEAPCSSPESVFQGTRRPRPGVPQSRGALAPAPASATLRGV